MSGTSSQRGPNLAADTGRPTWLAHSHVTDEGHKTGSVYGQVLSLCLLRSGRKPQATARGLGPSPLKLPLVSGFHCGAQVLVEYSRAVMQLGIQWWGRVSKTKYISLSSNFYWVTFVCLLIGISITYTNAFYYGADIRRKQTDKHIQSQSLVPARSSYGPNPRVEYCQCQSVIVLQYRNRRDREEVVNVILQTKTIYK